MNKKTFFCLLIFGCCLNFNVEAQEYKRADSFFKRGEANTVFQKNKQNGFINNQENKKEPLPSQTAIKPAKKTQNNILQVRPTPSGESTAKGKQVITIGAIIDGTNKRHYEQCIQSLFKLSDKFEFDLDKIYITSLLNNIDKESILSLLVRGATVSPVPAPPEEYNVTASPTWIVQTEDGQVVLEGIVDLGRYFNSRGEFVSKAQKSSIVEEKRPRLEMKSFFVDKQHNASGEKPSPLKEKDVKSFF